MAHIWQSPLWPRFTHDPTRTESALAAFTLRAGTWAGLQEAVSPDEQRKAFVQALTREAVASHALDGVFLSEVTIKASVVASLAHGTAPPQNHSDAVANMMLDARAGQGALTEDRLHHWHGLLFHDVEVDEKARWRSFEMVIVKSARAGREEVYYTAPPPGQVTANMADFLGWLNAPSDLPTPLRAALAHLWFESIHPYSAGNGRVGRAIVEHVFARDFDMPFSLSRQIEADKRGYYAALQAGRQEGQGGIDGTDFVLWFLDRLSAGVAEAEADARLLVRRNRYFLRVMPLPQRAERVLRELFIEGQGRVDQGLSAGPYAQIAGVSLATATRDLTELESLGALVRGPERGRSTRYRLTL